MGRLVLHWVCVCALVVPLIGCGEETAATGGSGGSGGTGGDAGMGGAGGSGGDAGTGGTGGVPPVTMSLRTVEAGGVNPPLEGVRVCQEDTDNCVTSNVLGEAALVLPANQEITYTLEKEGYGPYVVGDVTDNTWGITASSLNPAWSMFSDEQLAEQSALIETSYPWTGGVLVLRALPKRAGVTCEIDTETAKPFYYDEDDLPSLDLTATTSNGDCGFAEVSPGVHEIEFGGTATNCEASIAWPTDLANAIKVPARDGHLTYGSMLCPPE